MYRFTNLLHLSLCSSVAYLQKPGHAGDNKRDGKVGKAGTVIQVISSDPISKVVLYPCGYSVHKGRYIASLCKHTSWRRTWIGLMSGQRNIIVL